MRYGIFSDVHANWEALQAVLSALSKENIDEYLCLGDLVGYGSNPGECVEAVKEVSRITVAGNHDWASIGLFSTAYFNTQAAEAIIWTGQRLDEASREFLGSLELTYANDDLTLVHGSLNEPDMFNYVTDIWEAEWTFNLLHSGVCFIGHLHVPGVFVRHSDNIHYFSWDSFKLSPEKKYIVNVGSVGQPRDGNPEAAYCIYDSQAQQVEIKRVAYDVQAARNKIIEAGLPRILGERLLKGR